MTHGSKSDLRRWMRLVEGPSDSDQIEQSVMAWQDQPGNDGHIVESALPLVESGMLYRDSAQPAIESHRIRGHDGTHSGNVIVIDYMEVLSQRRGEGRRVYQAWEAQLPADIVRVELVAVDVGRGESMPFWEAMGFTHQYTGDGCDDDMYAHMWKGVNGHPTPPSIVVDD